MYMYARDNGGFCISIDLELAWGVWDHVTPADLRRCIDLEGPICRRLLKLFEKYDISATWAAVGRMLEKRTDCAAAEAAAWYAPEILASIAKAKPRQEIGSHSFGHIYFNESPEPALRADLERAKTLHRKYGYDFQSFVFPRNKVARTHLLAEAGIKIYRSTDAGWHMRFASVTPRLRRLVNLVDKLVPLAPPVVRPLLRNEGVIELPSSMLFMGRNGMRKLIRPRALQRKARLGMERAHREKAIFHMWFHPSNFYFEMESQFATLEAILQDAVRLREAGRLDVINMGEIAREFLTQIQNEPGESVGWGH